MTALARGTVNTRWRDFADVYLLSRRYRVHWAELAASLQRVADHRWVELSPLARILDGYGAIGQGRWQAWRKKQQLEDRLPEQFADVVSAVVFFADPVIEGPARDSAWDPGVGAWS